MAAVESEADDRFMNIDVDSILTRVGRRPLTLNKTRFLNKIPEFTKRLTGEETVHEGTTVQLELSVSGFPCPTLRWFKDSEEIVDHPRIHVENNENGVYVFTIENVNKGDEAAYRCKAENDEGVSSCMFYLYVKLKPKRSPKRSSKAKTRRTVSFPPMFPTIVEKVEEEEKAAKETARSAPSPLTQLYDGITLQTRHTWPEFLGDWAYVEHAHRNGGSLDSETDSEPCDGRSLESIEHDDVFSEEILDTPSSEEHSAFYLGSDDKSPETPDTLPLTSDSSPETPDTCPLISDSSPETPETAPMTTDSSPETPDTSLGVSEYSTGDEKFDNFQIGTENVIVDNMNENDNHNFVDNRNSESESINFINTTEVVLISDEPNNNELVFSKGNRDMHLPLSNGNVSDQENNKEYKENVLQEKPVKKKKDVSVSQRTEEKKSGSDKIKSSKKTEDKEKGEKSVKKIDRFLKKFEKTEEKDKIGKHVKKDKIEKSVKKTEEKPAVDISNKKTSEKEKSVKQVDDKVKSEKSVKSPKSENKVDKLGKKTTEKDKSEKSVKKIEKNVKKTEKSEEKANSETSESSNTITENKDEIMIKPKVSSEKKSSKTKDSKEKRIQSPKRKKEPKENKDIDVNLLSDPPLLGSARPLILTNMAPVLTSCPCITSECDPDPKDVYLDTSYAQVKVMKDKAMKVKEVIGDVFSRERASGGFFASLGGDVPFGKYFEEFVFVVCLFTFVSLCIGIPTEKFVLVILGMHFFYSIATIMGLC